MMSVITFMSKKLFALLGEISFSALFSLIWPLGWLSEPDLELLFLNGLLPLTQLGPPLRRDLDGSA